MFLKRYREAHLTTSSQGHGRGQTALISKKKYSLNHPKHRYTGLDLQISTSDQNQSLQSSLMHSQTTPHYQNALLQQQRPKSKPISSNIKMKQVAKEQLYSPYQIQDFSQHSSYLTFSPSNLYAKESSVTSAKFKNQTIPAKSKRSPQRTEQMNAIASKPNIKRVMSTRQIQSPNSKVSAQPSQNISTVNKSASPQKFSKVTMERGSQQIDRQAMEIIQKKSPSKLSNNSKHYSQLLHLIQTQSNMKISQLQENKIKTNLAKPKRLESNKEIYEINLSHKECPDFSLQQENKQDQKSQGVDDGLNYQQQFVDMQYELNSKSKQNLKKYMIGSKSSSHLLSPNTLNLTRMSRSGRPSKALDKSPSASSQSSWKQKQHSIILRTKKSVNIQLEQSFRNYQKDAISQISPDKQSSNSQQNNIQKDLIQKQDRQRAQISESSREKFQKFISAGRDNDNMSSSRIDQTNNDQVKTGLSRNILLHQGDRNNQRGKDKMSQTLRIGKRSHAIQPLELIVEEDNITAKKYMINKPRQSINQISSQTKYERERSLHSYNFHHANMTMTMTPSQQNLLDQSIITTANYPVMPLIQYQSIMTTIPSTQRNQDFLKLHATKDSFKSQDGFLSLPQQNDKSSLIQTHNFFSQNASAQTRDNRKMANTLGLSERMQKTLQSESRASATRGGIGRNTSIKPRSTSPLSINAKSLIRQQSISYKKSSVKNFSQNSQPHLDIFKQKQQIWTSAYDNHQLKQYNELLVFLCSRLQDQQDSIQMQKQKLREQVKDYREFDNLISNTIQQCDKNLSIAPKLHLQGLREQRQITLKQIIEKEKQIKSFVYQKGYITKILQLIVQKAENLLQEANLKNKVQKEENKSKHSTLLEIVRNNKLRARDSSYEDLENPKILKVQNQSAEKNDQLTPKKIISPLQPIHNSAVKRTHKYFSQTDDSKLLSEQLRLNFHIASNKIEAKKSVINKADSDDTPRDQLQGEKTQEEIQSNKDQSKSTPNVKFISQPNQSKNINGQERPKKNIELNLQDYFSRDDHQQYQSMIFSQQVENNQSYFSRNSRSQQISEFSKASKNNTYDSGMNKFPLLSPINLINSNQKASNIEFQPRNGYDFAIMPSSVIDNKTSSLIIQGQPNFEDQTHLREKAQANFHSNSLNESKQNELMQRFAYPEIKYKADGVKINIFMNIQEDQLQQQEPQSDAQNSYLQGKLERQQVQDQSSQNFNQGMPIFGVKDTQVENKAARSFNDTQKTVFQLTKRHLAINERKSREASQDQRFREILINGICQLDIVDSTEASKPVPKNTLDSCLKVLSDNSETSFISQNPFYLGVQNKIKQLLSDSVKMDTFQSEVEVEDEDLQNAMNEVYIKSLMSKVKSLSDRITARQDPSEELQNQDINSNTIMEIPNKFGDQKSNFRVVNEDYFPEEKVQITFDPPYAKDKALSTTSTQQAKNHKYIGRDQTIADQHQKLFTIYKSLNSPIKNQSNNNLNDQNSLIQFESKRTLNLDGLQNKRLRHNLNVDDNHQQGYQSNQDSKASFTEFNIQLTNCKENLNDPQGNYNDEERLNQSDKSEDSGVSADSFGSSRKIDSKYATLCFRKNQVNSFCCYGGINKEEEQKTKIQQQFRPLKQKIIKQ